MPVNQAQWRKRDIIGKEKILDADDLTRIW